MADVPRWTVVPSIHSIGAIYSGTDFRTTREIGSHNGLLASQPHYRLKNGSWSGGGSLYVYKKSYDANFPLLSFRQLLGTGASSAKPGHACHALVPAELSTPTPPTFETQRSTLASDYASGFKRTRPGNGQAGMGQFLIELRDFPTLPLRHLATLRNFRSLGDEYLNVVFGWKPFINDLRKMYNLWHKIDSELAKLIRQNGHGINRRATIRDDTSVIQNANQTVAAPFSSVSGYPTIGNSGTSHVTQTTTTTSKVWFSAKYRYYIPDIGSSQWTRRAKLALFGALPTPELIWEVLPWSWLVDWFSNVGDIMSNISPNAVENLVTLYSFTMRHDTTTVDYQVDTTWNGVSNGVFSMAPGSETFRLRVVTETKLRLGGGNPYGLDVSFGDLSGYQVGILAALGISRQKLL